MPQTLNKTDLLSEIDKVVDELKGSMESLDDSKVNTVPFENSWTPVQLFRHVTKSTNGMAKAMLQQSSPVERDPAERIGKLHETMMNFSVKMQAPQFILPEQEQYEKGAAIDALTRSFDRFKESYSNANDNEVVEGLPFGPVSKLEMAHFLLYHTQRHLHQMQKIREALQNEN